MASTKSLKRKRHSETWWANHAPEHIQRCSAHMRQDLGRQCNREAVAGLNVCEEHGGATPTAVAAAFTRLGGSVEDAAETVAAIMADPDASPRDRLAAAAHVMKLLGMERERVDVRLDADPIESLFRSILSDKDGLRDTSEVYVKQISPEDAALAAWADPDERPVDLELLGGPSEVVDAELVEEGVAFPSDSSTSSASRPRGPRRPRAGRCSDAIDPPKHVREALERADLW